jgi:hypothetical protein
VNRFFERFLDIQIFGDASLVISSASVHPSIVSSVADQDGFVDYQCERRALIG